MLYIYLRVLYYHSNLYVTMVTEGAYPGRRGFPLSQRSFLLVIYIYLKCSYNITFVTQHGFYICVCLKLFFLFSQNQLTGVRIYLPDYI